MALELFSFTILGKTMVITTWTLFGFLGNLLFLTRVMIQWIATEKQKRTVVPVSFWWVSLAAALVFIVYAFRPFPDAGPDKTIHRIPFILGFAVTLVPYTRNLWIHYRPNRPPRPIGLIILIAIILVCLAEIAFWHTNEVSDKWFLLGMLGNAIFSGRFIVQWIETERLRRPTLSVRFWYMSLVGSFILLVYSLQQGDPVFIIGFLFNAIPYVRNLMIIYRNRATPPAADQPPLPQTDSLPGAVTEPQTDPEPQSGS